jgi:hypothetical protein
MASDIGDVFLQSVAQVDALPQEWDAATAPTPFPVAPNPSKIIP